MRNKSEKRVPYCRLVWVLMIILAIGTLAGCTYPSGEKVFQEVEEAEKKPAGDAQAVLADALDATLHKESAREFWYSGWVANDLQKRRTTAMFDGVVVRPHGYLVNARLAGTPYRYYKWDDSYFLHTESKGWSRVKGERLPLDPFLGLTWWEPFLEQAMQLPNQEVLGKECLVFSVEVTGAQWLLESKSPLFEDLRKTVDDTPGLEQLLGDSKVKMTLWIGKQDQLIYQYQTWINLPVPAAGYMDQEIFFRFYKYGDPGIKLKTPEEMEQEVSVDNNTVNGSC